MRMIVVACPVFPESPAVCRADVSLLFLWYLFSMHKLLTALAVFAFLVTPVSAATLNTDTILKNGPRDSEIYVGKDGTVVISGAKVMQLAGRSFYTRLYWGESFLRLLVKTGPATRFERGTGEVTDYTEINEGDYLNMEGRLESGASTFTLIPTYVQNVSVQKGSKTFAGTVASVNPGAGTFTLSLKGAGIITVKAEGAVFTKGSRTIDLARVEAGDTVTSATGVYDYNTQTLTASAVAIYLDKNLYKWQNFEGKLLETPGVNPASIKVSIGGTEFAVLIPSDIIVWNSARKSVASFARFVAGDTIRLHGKRQETDTPSIEADIIRNMNL